MAWDRRTVLTRLIEGTGALLGAVVVLPALVSGLAPGFRRRRGERWVEVGRLDEFPLDRVERAVVERPRADWAESLRQFSVYVWRRAEDEAVVYSRNCTDVSCPINFDPGSECFFCPCHGGIFGKDGRRMAGPPTRSLFGYATRVRDGVLQIDLNSLPPMT